MMDAMHSAVSRVLLEPDQGAPSTQQEYIAAAVAVPAPPSGHHVFLRGLRRPAHAAILAAAPATVPSPAFPLSHLRRRGCYWWCCWSDGLRGLLQPRPLPPPPQSIWNRWNGSRPVRGWEPSHTHKASTLLSVPGICVCLRGSWDRSVRSADCLGIMPRTAE